MSKPYREYAKEDIYKLKTKLKNIRHIAEYGVISSKAGNNTIDYSYILNQILDECDR